MIGFVIMQSHRTSLQCDGNRCYIGLSVSSETGTRASQFKYKSRCESRNDYGGRTSARRQQRGILSKCAAPQQQGQWAALQQQGQRAAPQQQGQWAAPEQQGQWAAPEQQGHHGPDSGC
jgi:hypothetical protein